jgi:integrase
LSGQTKKDKKVKTNRITAPDQSLAVKAKDGKMRGVKHHSYDRGGIVCVYGRIDGKTYRFSTGKKANAANLAWAAREWKTLILEHITPKSDKPTFNDFARRVLAATASNRREYTQRSYERDYEAEIAPVFGDREVATITPLEVQEWQTALLTRKSASRARSYRKIFTLVLKAAVIEGLLSRNPFEIVKAPPVRYRQKRPFSLEETKTLINNASGWFKNFLTLSFFTGLRTGEALGLEWKHINFVSKTIRIEQSLSHGTLGDPKTIPSFRTIEMLPAVEKALRDQYLQTGLKGGYLFLTKFNNPVRYLTHVRNDHWAKLLKRCLLDYRELYTTRHTFASLMLSNREDPLWVSRMLGHKNLAITLQVYAIETKSTQKIAAFLEGAFADGDDAKQDCTAFAQNLHIGDFAKIG